MTKNILFLDGIADNGKVKVTSITKNNSMFFQLNGNANIADFLNTDRITPFKITFDLDPKQDLKSQPTIQAIFNQISDADTHIIALGKAQALHKVFADKLPFFNAPANVIKTRRDIIYQLLQGIDKLHVPKTVRLQPKSPSDIYDVIKNENFSFPVIFRQAGDHGGISTVRIKDETESFDAFALDGRDYYLTQFVDYADEDGIYAKYRLVVVDGEVFIRHVIFNDSWIIHSQSRKYMEKNKKYQKLEANTLKSFNGKIKPKIQGIIEKICQQLELDYFGIDCAIDKNFNIILFESNANMNILINNAKSSNNIWTKQIDIISKAIIKMISKDTI